MSLHSFLIIGGFEITNSMRHFVPSGYSSLEEMLIDLDIARNLVLNSIIQAKKESPEAPFDVNAFLDKINKEKDQGL